MLRWRCAGVARTAAGAMERRADVEAACAQVGIFQVMFLGRSAAVAHSVVSPMEPFPAFRDASSGAPCFLLRIQHVLAVRALMLPGTAWHAVGSAMHS